MGIWKYRKYIGDDIEMSIMIIISLLGFTVGTKIYSLLVKLKVYKEN